MIAKSLGRVVLALIFPIFLFGNIEFRQKVVKQNPFLNETVKVILELSVSNDLQIEDVYFDRYESADFWAKEFVNKKITKLENETIYAYEYLLDAKNFGDFILPKQKIEITSEQIRRFKKWEKVYSNEEKITVLPLFENQAIQGNYEINISINQKKIKANEALNLSLEIKGNGNIQDIKAFDLNLDEQTVYKDKPTINKEFMEDSYKGIFTQKFMIIANKSFTIPSFSFEYFNMKKQKVEKISTSPIFVEVEELPPMIGEDKSLKYIFAFVGFLFGLGSLFLLNFAKKYYKKANDPFVKKIKKAKDDKELYELLIKHPKSADFRDIIKLLEENIYKNEKHFINKKEIIKELFI